MSLQITFLERCKALGIADKNLPAWLDEIESLRAQIVLIEAETIERCAAVCEESYEDYHGTTYACHEYASDCAAAIRSLK